MKITLVVPTLNEIDGMKEIMPRVKSEWVDQILVIEEGKIKEQGRHQELLDKKGRYHDLFTYQSRI